MVSHSKATLRSPAVVQGRVNLGNRVERTEDRMEDRTEDRRITGQRTGQRTEQRTEHGTGQRIVQDRSRTYLVSHSKAAMRRLSAARQWSRAEYTWGIGLRGQKIGQSTGWRTGELQDKGQGGGQEMGQDRK